MIDLEEEKLRINHSSYWTEGGWLAPPSKGQQAHYDLVDKGTASLKLLIGSSMGQTDRISIVNPSLKTKAKFTYKVMLNS